MNDMLKLAPSSHGERGSTAFSYGNWEIRSESRHVNVSMRWVARSPVQEYSHLADTHALNLQNYRDTPLPMTAPFFNLALA